MFQLSSEPNLLFSFFQNPTSLYNQHHTHEVPAFASPYQKKQTHSGKKLNFEDSDDVVVSEFDFGCDNVMQSACKNRPLMEIEEEINTPQNDQNENRLTKETNMRTPPKNNKGSFPFLQVTVPNKQQERKTHDFNETAQKNNQNIIGHWRNDDHQVFKGKFSSGATPKLNKDFKLHNESPQNLLKANKKIKKSLFACAPAIERKEQEEASKENIGDSFNMNLEHEFLRERTPSPRQKNCKDRYNTMSIKKERKIFNKMEDLEEDEDLCPEEFRFMTNQKASKLAASCEVNTNSRFVNDYEIIEVIGSGCFGTVYKCLNKFDNMVYAIKCTKNRIKGTKTRHLSLHEAQALASFSSCDENSFIVRYYNAWIEDERLYLVMEHCLYSLKFLKQNPNHHFSESQIRHILRDMAEGLKSLHKRNVVHLDIKPDLGLSRIAKRSKGEEISEGDSRYLAPELLLDLFDGNLPDLTKADIFSLGVTLYELMTKENIPSNGEEWHRLRRLELPKLMHLTNYSDTLKKLIISMMNPNPDLRPSAEQLLVSDFLRSEIEMELKWEKTQNILYQEKIKEYERILKVKRKKSF